MRLTVIIWSGQETISSSHKVPLDSHLRVSYPLWIAPCVRGKWRNDGCYGGEGEDGPWQRDLEFGRQHKVLEVILEGMWRVSCRPNTHTWGLGQCCDLVSAVYWRFLPGLQALHTWGLSVSLEIRFLCSVLTCSSSPPVPSIHIKYNVNTAIWLYFYFIYMDKTSKN